MSHKYHHPKCKMSNIDKVLEYQDEECIDCIVKRWDVRYRIDKNRTICDDCYDWERYDSDSDSDSDDGYCPSCKKDINGTMLDMNYCLECEKNIGCTECAIGWTIKERTYCEEHEHLYEDTSDDESEVSDSVWSKSFSSESDNESKN